MTRERLDELTAAYGADPRRWPEAERAQARALPGADAALRREAALDDALDAWTTAAPSFALRERILAAAPRPVARIQLRGAWTWLAGTGLAAACAAGLAVGVWTAPVDTLDTDATVTAALAPYEPAVDLNDEEILG